MVGDGGGGGGGGDGTALGCWQGWEGMGTISRQIRKKRNATE